MAFQGAKNGGRTCPFAIGISETHVACHVCQMWHATFNCRTTTEQQKLRQRQLAKWQMVKWQQNRAINAANCQRNAARRSGHVTAEWHLGILTRMPGGQLHWQNQVDN